MTRSSRQNKILELIATKDIEKQEDLVLELHNYGYMVTQATVSRDIKELNIVKVTVNGKQKYSKEQSGNSNPSTLEDMIRYSVLSIDHAMNIVVIKTISGSANVAALMIDNMHDPDILGTIAGDDTTAVITRNEQVAIKLKNIILDIVNDWGLYDT